MHMKLPDAMMRAPNAHRDQLQPFYGAAPRLCDTRTEFLFLCYTNRCGSHFLAELLASTGRFNYAGEVFNADSALADIHRHDHPDLAAFCDHLCASTARNGTLAAKLATSHLAVLAEAGLLDQILPRARFVFLHRADKLAQAISLSIAAQTQQWTSYMQPRVPAEQLLFSARDIDAIIADIVDQQGAFEHFFALNGIRPYALVYEQLCAEPAASLAALGKWLGAGDLRAQPDKLSAQKQAGDLNRRWREMYLSGQIYGLSLRFTQAPPRTAPYPA
jgi:LPS sulfotransferase NodH